MEGFTFILKIEADKIRMITENDENAIRIAGIILNSMIDLL